MFVFFHQYVLTKIFGITYFFQNTKQILDKTVRLISESIYYLKIFGEFREDYF